MTEKPKKLCGFAAMTPERRREISSMGGKKTPNNFKNNPEFAAKMGRLGKKRKKTTEASDGQN